MIIAAVLLMTLVPAVSAYESYAVNVKVHVVSYNCTKTIELASDDDVEYLIGQGLIPADVDPDQPDVDPDYPDEVPIETCVVWVVRIHFVNSDNCCYTDLVIKDRFGAELAGEEIGVVPVEWEFKAHNRGTPKKEKQSENFTTQYRITWYVTCEEWDAEAEECIDNSGLLCPGESAYLEMYVWTKMNPSGRQEYTSTGNYTLNSGPTAKWINDCDGHQYSTSAPPVYIYAY